MMMLASPSKDVAATPDEAIERLSQRQWLFDIKWDGVRMQATIDDGAVTLVNRSRRDVTWKYPDVCATLAGALPIGHWVLDGEVVAFDADGKPDFQLVARRDAVETTAGAQRALHDVTVVFICFDLLEITTHDLRATPYSDRLDVLRQLSNQVDGLTLSTTSDNGNALWAAVQRLGLEGLIAKNPDGKYRTGRSDEWVKIKVAHRASFRVTEYQPGTGRLSDTVGALLLDLHDGDKWVRVGKVGTGFTDDERRHLQTLLDSGTELVVEVEYANTTSTGTPRFPSYKGVRSDLPVTACTTDQLKETK